MADIVLKYFDTLFSSSNPSPQVIDDLISSVNSMVCDTMNGFLDERFSATEVDKTAFNLHPSKALGTDGFTTFFLQKSWPLVRDNLTYAVLNILNKQGDMSKWNEDLKSYYAQGLKTYKPLQYLLQDSLADHF